MNKWTNSYFAFGLALATSWATTASLATSAFAAAPTPAEQHFGEAMSLFQQGEIEQACTIFAQSYAEAAAPGTLYNLSICREKQGRFADAYRGFDQLATRAEASPGHEDKAASVRARANALIPQLGRVDLVHRKDARSEVTAIVVDDTVLLADAWKKPVYVMPGTHTVLVKHADGTDVTRHTSVLTAGKSESLEMEDPAPLPETPLGPNASAPLVMRETTQVNKKRRTLAYVAGGAGVALLAGGAVFGVLAIKKRSDANAVCNGPCAAAGGETADQRKQDSYNVRSTGKTYATVSDVGFIAGAGAAAAAVLLYVTSSRKEMATDSTTVSGWRLAPTGDAHGAGALLQGSF